MSRFKVVMLAAVLAALGLGLFAYKVRFLGYPVWPDAQAQIWTVEVRLAFDAAPGPVKASLFIPGLTPGFAILDENFVSRGFGFTTPYVSGGRQVQWAVRHAEGPQALYYRVVVYRDPVRQESDTTPPFPPVPKLAEPFNTAMEMLVERVRGQSADPASFTAELLKRLARPGGDQDIELLLGDAPAAVDRARTAMTVLAAASIPARLLHGVRMAERERSAEMQPWLEVHDGERWLYFDPVTGNEGLPADFLIWWRGEEPVVQVDGGNDVDITTSIHSSVADPIIVARRRAEAHQDGVAEFSLFALPIQSQAVYGVLLAVPVGALLVVLLRNVIGVQTFGTFMPVLIALAFRETQLLWGVLLFSVLVFIGLSIRFYMEKLRLLLVPRLAAVLTIVVLLMVLVSLLSHRLGFEIGLSVGLFPMVIMTMTIERMSIVWEERGPGDAIKQGLGSLLVAATCYLIMGLALVEHLVFVFPELLLVALAATLLLGRYTGYRLTELLRFRELRGDA
ncbi:MAG: inactive transglutaminase family protein [Gammaproteobacteria bacterium]|nr:inactive transglutaminase family protein [Gammaproteobacteria bacterium]